MLYSLALVVAAVPLTPQDRWITPGDYPPAQLKEGIGGNVGAELTVNSDGKPARCLIIVSSNNGPLDVRTCTLLMQRAQFQPWKGKVPRTYRAMVRWQIDNGLPHTPAVSTGMIQTIKLKPDGYLDSCKQEIFGDYDENEPDFCGDIVKTWDEQMSQAPETRRRTAHIDSMIYRMTVQENNGGEPHKYPPSENAALVDSSYAIFTVDPSGKITDCSMVRRGERLQDMDFCAIKGRSEGFSPDPTRTKPILLDFLFERWVIPR